MLKGCCTALITPFNNSGNVCRQYYRHQINFQLKNGVSGVLACGTTGEAPALSEDELYSTIKAAVEYTAGRAYVMAGTGTNNTKNTIERTKQAKKLGADYALVITPYYNKPNQAGLYSHFKTVAQQTNMDIVIYNVPSRTGVSINPDTVAELSKIKNIVGIKEASGSLNQATEIMMKAKKGFVLMSGEDSLTLPLMSIGASGVICTTSNIIPAAMQSLFELYFASEMEEAMKMHRNVYDLTRVLFCEVNPVPLKYAMKSAGMDRGNLRLPLAELSNENKKKVDTVLKEMNILKNKR